MAPFRLLLRVRYGECDAQQVVFNARYGDYVDVAATEFYRAVFGSYQALLEQGLDSQVVRMVTDWRAPARFDDVLRVHARCAGLRGARFRFEYAVELNGQLVVEGHTGHACVNAQTLVPTRAPGWLVEAIRAAEGPDSDA